MRSVARVFSRPGVLSAEMMCPRTFRGRGSTERSTRARPERELEPHVDRSLGEGENLAIGDAVNVAARLEQAAEPGEIVLGGETLTLVRDAVVVEALEPLALRGKSEPVHAYRLVRVDPVAPGLARRLDVPLVGRERELALLQQAWDRAVQESRCHLLTLLGEAGVGKSRLISELLSGVGDRATVLCGRCLHYGQGITFWPLVEALLPVGERAARMLEHLSSGGVAAPEELGGAPPARGARGRAAGAGVPRRFAMGGTDVA